MKKITAMLLLSLSICFSVFSVFADFKVAVIDLQKVLQASPKVATVDAAFRQQFQPREASIKLAAQTLQTNVTQFKRNAPTMTDVQKVAAEDKINKQRNDVQLLQAQFQQDVQDMQAKAMQTILEQINVVVKTIAIKEKYDLILQSSSVVYYKPTYDISQQVIKALK